MNITVDMSESVTITLIVAACIVLSIDGVYFLLKYCRGDR